MIKYHLKNMAFTGLLGLNNLKMIHLYIFKLTLAKFF